MISRKLLFVVHRAAPFPGGSEYYVHNMAVESARRGHDVTVFAMEHKGDYQGIKVTNDPNILLQYFDLIIVHGGDASAQNVVHMNAEKIPSPILYMIIKPSMSEACQKGLVLSKYLGYSTTADIEFIRGLNAPNVKFWDKARRVRHGIPVPTIPASIDLYETYGLSGDKSKPVYVSAGGFYHNKAMTPLCEAFENSDFEGRLIIFGYGMPENAPKPKTNKVVIVTDASQADVLQAIKSANGYIQNSTEEGFGLVLLEASLLGTRWYARDIAGAHDMSKYGIIYKDEADLIAKLKSGVTNDLDAALQYVQDNHLIGNTVDDIEAVLQEEQNHERGMDLGSGPHPDQTCEIRVDLHKWPSVTHLQDLLKAPYQFSDECVDRINFGDVIEHIDIFSLPTVMSEIKRMLKPAGKLTITCPDMLWIAERIVKNDWYEKANVGWLNQSTDPHENAMSYLFGGFHNKDEYQIPGMGHVNGFTFASLKKLLTNHGFADIVRVDDERNPMPARDAVLKVICRKP
ncbi:MAG: glycosyltransferase [Bacteroidota bacterium]|jgi:glycosyltransferase involved in cell wall biosynthesis